MAFSRGGRLRSGLEAKASSGPKRAPQSSLAIVSEGVLKRFTLVMVAICAVGLFSGCQKSSVIGLPPAPPARMFVADFANGLVVFTQPFTPASTASFTIAGSDGGLVFDSASNLYVSHVSAHTIDVYTPPVGAASVPSFTIGPITGAGSLFGMAFDTAGNLYIADENGAQVLVLKPPFVAGVQLPFQAIKSSGPFNPVGVAFDLQGRLEVGNYATKSVTIFSPPFVNGVNTPVGTMATPTGAIGISRAVTGNLIVGQADGTLAIITPPFATGVVPSTIIPSPSLGGNPKFPAVEALNSTTDAAGNLWVPYGGDGGLAPPPPLGGANEFGIAEFNPPFSGASFSAIGLFQTGLAFPIGIAFGP